MDETRWVDIGGLRHAKARYKGFVEKEWHYWYVSAFKIDEVIEKVQR